MLALRRKDVEFVKIISRQSAFHTLRTEMLTEYGSLVR